MNKKAIILTFVSAVAVVCLAGVLSYLVWSSQPSADTEPPVPPLPEGAPAERPPVPPSPRLAGDILDDGIVNALDINSIIVHWKQFTSEYNLVDANSETKKCAINSLDLNQTIKYWQCYEQKGVTTCPYLNYDCATAATVSPTPTASASATDEPPTPGDVTTAVSTATKTSDGPPTPPSL